MVYFFDLDGTLLDSNDIWLEIDVAFLARFGISPVPEDYSDYVTHHNFPDSARYTKEYFGLSLSPEEIVAAWREMAQEAYAGQLVLKPGARDFLERANRAGISCVLLTSCIPKLCHAALRHHNLHPLLKEVLTTLDLGLEKRDPALFVHVARQFNLKPEECVLFDDSPVYCAAAKAAGWQVFGIAEPVFADRADEMAALCGPDRFPFDFSQSLPE